MRILFLFLLIVFSSTLYGQDLPTQNCRPSTSIKGLIFPNCLDSSYNCPAGRCCYTQLKASDNSLEIMSFTMTGYKLCNAEEDILESNNVGNVFSPLVE